VATQLYAKKWLIYGSYTLQPKEIRANCGLAVNTQLKRDSGYYSRMSSSRGSAGSRPSNAEALRRRQFVVAMRRQIPCGASFCIRKNWAPLFSGVTILWNFKCPVLIVQKVSHFNCALTSRIFYLRMGRCSDKIVNKYCRKEKS